MTSNTFNSNGHQFNDNFSSRIYNTNTSHPLIPSSQEYMFYKKYVSIHSEDRDIIKYPNSAEFEIELPQDYLNVASLRLSNWTFPANYNTFSVLNSNVTMTFIINNPYNPNINGVTDLLIQKIFECLFITQVDDFTIIIEEGFYNPQQMVTELTNKFNSVVTARLTAYFTQKSIDPTLTLVQQQEYIQALQLLNSVNGYSNFIIVYNNVGQKIWFGNICDGFTITNETLLLNNISPDILCITKTQLPDYSNWGLPSNLGLSRDNAISVNGSTLSNTINLSNYNGQVVPRFFYGDVFPGDNGFWLLPNSHLTNSEVNWIECGFKINLMGPAYMYMEIAKQNCIDETAPYNVSSFTETTNSTNGIVNSSFAKIAIPTTPISQWFDRDSMPYKYYYPPAERIRKLCVKLRYHNGEIVNFGVFNYSFVIEFTTQLPQLLRSSNSVVFPPTLNCQ
jgi:hypothetical protein